MIFEPSPGPQGVGPKNCAVAHPIHVSNSHTKFGWISSNGLGGDGITDGCDYNIPVTVLKKHGDNKAYTVYGVKPKIKSVSINTCSFLTKMVFSSKEYPFINTSLADTVLYNKVFRVHGDLTYKIGVYRIHVYSL